MKNPAWSRDELILALDLYMKNPLSPPSKGSPEIAQLSQVLNTLGSKLGGTKQSNYRNPNGVYMKLMNFRRFDPSFASLGKVGLERGGKEEEPVWLEYAHDITRLSLVAAGIRATIQLPATELEIPIHSDDEFVEAEEGRILTYLHRTRERNKKLVRERKSRALEEHGRLKCEGCGFDFEECYGVRGRGFIEAHHTKPVHTLAEGAKTKLTDLALVCSNCHRMIHAARPWLTMDDLRILVRTQEDKGDLLRLSS